MSEKKIFEVTAENKGKATQLRIFAFIAWLVAIGIEVFAIFKLIRVSNIDDNLMWIIIALIVMLALTITGSLLWKKSNRLDPASEAQPVKFFIQNQLGVIMSILAFAPIVILIFSNKDASKKTKGIAGAVAALALVIAGVASADFAPPSIEKYTEQINAQTDTVKRLTNNDHVYWATASGARLHLFEDCQHLKNSKDIGQGSVEEAWDARKIGDNEICKTCENRAIREKDLPEDILDDIPLEDAA